MCEKSLEQTLSLRYHKDEITPGASSKRRKPAHLPVEQEQQQLSVTSAKGGRVQAAASHEHISPAQKGPITQNQNVFPPVINSCFWHQWVRLLLTIHSNNLTFLCGVEKAEQDQDGEEDKQSKQSPVQGDSTKTLCLFSYPNSRKGTCPQPQSHN